MPLTKAEITRLRSLQEKKHREALGLFVVEGEKVVGELLAAGFPFTEIYATEKVERNLRACFLEPGQPVLHRPVTEEPRPRRAGAGAPPPRMAACRVPSPVEASASPVATSAVIPPTRDRLRTTLITPAEMARLSHYPTPSTVLAVGQINRPPLAPGALDRGLTLALDGIQDPGNVGTLLRVADWFAFDRVLLSPDTADLFSQKVINASMGSFARVTCHTAPLPDALPGVKTPVLGCDLQGKDVHTLKPLRDAVIVIGNEGRGLSETVRPFVTYYITIPKFGAAESLNAAVAAAIVCDNLRRTAK